MHRLVIDIFAFQLLVYAPNSSREWLSAIHKKEVSVVEIILGLVCLSFAIGFVIEKAIQLIKSLKTKGSAKLKNGFQVSLSVIPIDKKVEHVHPTQNSEINDIER